ncbi:hypothetical protein BGZ65_009780 [Modicella reniformis]|uniref:Uncharacterized protein n=1 Tax=Modicella reniformis TaxID=1440133 RepID=A0A9P6MKJ4_9FUNG|nr:hypothetical protein BGZ65_009780 [Modicella reniformis]
MELLQPHFSTLTELDLGYNNSMTSAMAQELLSSCSSLFKFRAPRIEALDIVEGKPWMCLRIQYLSAGIHFDPSTIKVLQPLIFDQLSKLTRLRVLAVGHVSEIAFQETMELRLESGLGKLSSLRLLRCIGFSNTKQMMGKQEIEWMLKHWKALERIHGQSNAYDANINDEMETRLIHCAIRTMKMMKRVMYVQYSDFHEIGILLKLVL